MQPPLARRSRRRRRRTQARDRARVARGTEHDVMDIVALVKEVVEKAHCIVSVFPVLIFCYSLLLFIIHGMFLPFA